MKMLSARLRHRPLLSKILFGGGQLAMGHAGSQFLVFLRNLIVARILIPEDFGLAVTFGMSMSLFEAFTDLGVEKILVQAQNGNDIKLQSTLHSVMLIRAGLISAAIFFAADALAAWFGSPEASWAYQALAIAPIARGLMHTDPARFHRRLQFKADVIGVVTSQVIGFSFAVALAFLWGDFRCVLVGILVQNFALLGMSRLLATRKYQLGWNHDVLKQVMIFGWPLLINGALIFVSNVADRFLVGRFIGLTELALYSVVAITFLSPTMAITNISSALILPVLSKFRDDRNEFTRKLQGMTKAMYLVMLLLVIPLMFWGAEIIEYVFGKNYRAPAALIFFLSLATAFKLVRILAVMVALAHGDTKSLMVANMVRSGGFGLAIVAVAAGMGIESIAAAMLAGEVAAYIVSTRRTFTYVVSFDSAGWKAIWLIAALLTMLWVGVNVVWPDMMLLKMAATLVGALGSGTIVAIFLREKAY